jgi:hypothetical protein
VPVALSEAKLSEKRRSSRREYLQKYQPNWLNRRREEWLAANGPCRQCRSWERLEVDHIDRAEKVTHRVWSWSKPRREAELAKCQVLCGDCHRAKTSAENASRADHGTRARYQHGCKCEPCVTANREYVRANRQAPPRPAA